MLFFKNTISVIAHESRSKIVSVPTSLISLGEYDCEGNTFRLVGEDGSSLDSGNELLGLFGFRLTFLCAAEMIEENRAPFFALESFNSEKKNNNV